MTLGSLFDGSGGFHLAALRAVCYGRRKGRADVQIN